MTSYRDIDRDGHRYTADEYLEIHRQLASNIKRDLDTNRDRNVGQTQGSGDHSQWQYGRDQSMNRPRHLGNLQRHLRESDPRAPQRAHRARRSH